MTFSFFPSNFLTDSFCKIEGDCNLMSSFFCQILFQRHSSYKIEDEILIFDMFVSIHFQWDFFHEIILNGFVLQNSSITEPHPSPKSPVPTQLPTLSSPQNPHLIQCSSRLNILRYSNHTMVNTSLNQRKSNYHEKSNFRQEKIKKMYHPKITSKLLHKPLIHSYERFKNLF